MPKGTRLVKTQGSINQQLIDDLIASQMKQYSYQASTTSINQIYTNTISNGSLSINTPPGNRGIKFHSENHDLLFEIDSRGKLTFYTDDQRKIVLAIERLWKKTVNPTVVTQTEIDALAYAAGIYIKNPKDDKCLREQAFDRLMELMLGQQIDYQEGDNPVILRRNL